MRIVSRSFGISLVFAHVGAVLSLPDRVEQVFLFPTACLLLAGANVGRDGREKGVAHLESAHRDLGESR